jgi:hypothetical protein
MRVERNARAKRYSRVRDAAPFFNLTLALFPLALFLWGDPVMAGSSPPAASGDIGFIVSSIAFAMGPDASQPGVCPQGLSKGFVDAYRAAGGTDADPRPDEQPLAYEIRIFQKAAEAPNGQNLCAFPLAAPDPFFRTVESGNLTTEGIDLDGQHSHKNGRPAPGTCAHDDFNGVDNQMYRVLGCVRGYQSNGLLNTFETEMLTGAWAILVKVSGADNLRNAPKVTVGLYASADPIRLSPDRQPLWNATYSADSDTRFRAQTTGRIINGVLTTDPVDVRFRWSAEGWRLVRPLLGARLQLELSADGSGSGFLSGYTPIDEWYRNNYSYAAAVNPDGTPPRPGHPIFSAVGTGYLQGFTCHGIYQAMQRLADGNLDPHTGKCTSVSTQYRIRVIPAFVVSE